MADYSNKRTTLSSRTCIDDLTNDVFTEILIRISCKSAFMCKLVCKRWFNLISDPAFANSFIARQHYQQEQQQEFLVHGHKEHKISTSQGDDLLVSLNFLPYFEQEKHEKLYIAGSCNGIVLCVDMHELTCYICNPITKQWAALPRLLGKPSYIGFICDPYYDIDEQGQVRINSNFRFKVVALLQYSTGLQSIMTSNVHMDLYSSEVGKWEWIELESVEIAQHRLQLYAAFGPRTSAFLYEKKMHWPILDNKILVYDPYNDSVHCLNQPYPEDPHFITTYLGICGDSLQLCRTSCLRFLTIWKLEDYDKSEWSFKHKVKIPITDLPLQMKVTFSNDPGVVYLYIDGSRIFSCNLQAINLTSLGSIQHFGQEPYNLNAVQVPYWPTPLPPSVPSHFPS